MEEETVNNIKKVYEANNFKKLTYTRRYRHSTQKSRRAMLITFSSKITPHSSHKQNTNKKPKVI